MEKRFSELIRELRLREGIPLREAARRMDISPSYYNDVEKGRRSPFEGEKLLEISNMLCRTCAERRSLFDGAAFERHETPRDVAEYILENEYVKEGIRAAMDRGADREEWLRFGRGESLREKENGCEKGRY